MGLVVLTRAASSLLVPMATVKARLGITDTSEDAMLTELLEQVTGAFAAEVPRLALMRQRYRETIDGRGRTRLVLAKAPIDPDSVTLTIDGTAATDFSVEAADAGVLYREDGWDEGALGLPGEDSEQNISVTYHAGFIPPGSAAGRGVWTAWAAAMTPVVGAWVKPTNPTASPLLMECTVAGTADATTEPAWPTVAGTTVIDGTAEWTARSVHALPATVSGLAFLAVRDLRAEQSTPAAISSMQADGVVEARSVSMLQEAVGGISKGVLAALRRWAGAWQS
jgi:hypothetical protein